MEKVLIIGGAGFIGFHTAEYLAKQGYEVTIVDRSSHGVPPEWQSRVRISELSVEKMPLGELKWADVVIYLPHTTLPQNSNERMGYDVSSNILPMISFLEQCVKNNVRKIIYASSGGTVYGNQLTENLRENVAGYPLCSYGITKLMIEKYLHLFQHLHGLQYSVLRIANPYGPRQSVQRGQGALTVFLHKILSRQPIQIWGDGSVIRDYIYIEDVARAFEASIRATEQKEPVYNIGSGCGYNLVELLQLVEMYVGYSAKVQWQEARAADVARNVLCIERAKRELEWKPSVLIQEGIRRTGTWMKEQMRLNDA